MLYSCCRFMLCLGSIILLSTVAFASDEKDTQDYCVDKFKDAGASVVASCHKITNDTAANCTLYLRQDQGNLIESCAKMFDSKMSEDCLKQVGLSHGGVDAETIQLCTSLGFLDTPTPSSKALVPPNASCVE